MEGRGRGGWVLRAGVRPFGLAALQVLAFFASISATYVCVCSQSRPARRGQPAFGGCDECGGLPCVFGSSLSSFVCEPSHVKCRTGRKRGVWAA
ncbi:hypothetical protein EV126DRAFT_426163 [Verticillium dahliae]|nr:hypothetical protein EV126DRAFT_426163 [Verticillium dahliae]